MQVVLTALAILSVPFWSKAVIEGKARTIGLPLLAVLVLLVGRLKERARFSLLLVAVLLVPLQTPDWPIPYALSVSELLLLLLTIVQLAMRWSSARLSRGTTKLAAYIPYFALASAGLVSALRNHELGLWYGVCLVPLLLLFLVDNGVRAPDDALRLMEVAMGATLGYLLIYWLAGQVGSVIDVYGPAMQWRIGARVARLGPIQYDSYSITFGTLAALGMPFVVLKISKARKPDAYRFVYGGVLILFIAILTLTSARGATIGAAIGAILALICSRRLRWPGVIAMSAILATTIMVWGPDLIRGSPSIAASEARWRDTRWADIATEGNLATRIATMRLTFENIGQNPLGYGYGFLWTAYRIDEAVAYSALLNGAGVGGFLSFLIIVGALLRRFVTRISRGSTSPQCDLAAIGLGTLLCGLIAGVSSESVLLGPVQSFVFWTVLCAAYCGTCSQCKPLRSILCQEI